VLSGAWWCSTAQKLGQCLVFGLTSRLNRSALSLHADLALQGLVLSLKTGLIGRQRLLEQLPLFCVHAPGLGTEAP